MSSSREYSEDFYSDIKQTPIVQWSSTWTPGAKLNAKKALKNKPWGKKQYGATHRKKKTIIFCADDSQDQKTTDALFTFLEDGFEIRVIKKSYNQFRQITRAMLSLFKRAKWCLDWFDDILIANKENMEKHLRSQHENPSHFYILDKYALIKWIDPNKEYVVLVDGSKSFETIKSVHRIEQVNHLICKQDLPDETIKNFSSVKKLTLLAPTTLAFEKLKLESCSFICHTLTKFPPLSETIQFLELDNINFNNGILDLTVYKHLVEIHLTQCRGIKKVLFPPTIKYIRTDIPADGWDIPKQTETFRYIRMPQKSDVFPFDLTGLKLKKLELRLSDADKLDEIIRPVLGTLKELTLSGGYIQSIPDLKSTLIENLQINHCQNLVEILGFPASLKDFACWKVKLIQFPTLKHTQIEKIAIRECLELKGFEDSNFPNSLTYLSLHSLNLQNIPSWEETHLKEVNLVKLKNLKVLPDFKQTLVEKVIIDLDVAQDIFTMPVTLKVFTSYSGTTLPKLDHTSLERLWIGNKQLTQPLLLPSTLKYITLNSTYKKPIEFKENVELNLQHCLGLREINGQIYGMLTRYPEHLFDPELHFKYESDFKSDKRDSKTDPHKNPFAINKYTFTNFSQDIKQPIDPKTKKNPNKILFTTYSIYRNIHQKPLHPSEYRHIIKDQIDIQDVRCITTFEEVKIAPTLPAPIEFTDGFTEEQLQLGDKRYLVQLPPSVPAGKWVALPGLNHGDQITLMTRIPEAKIRYSHTRGQYDLLLKKPLTEPLQYIAIENAIKINVYYLPFPDSLKAIFDKIFDEPYVYNKYPDYFNNLKKEISVLKKKDPKERAKIVLTALSDKEGFFKKYFDFNDNEDIEPNPWDNFCIQLLVHRQGACRHRAYAATLLFQYLQIPTRIIENEVHEFIEIYEKNAWHKIDLGGSFAELKPAPPLKTKYKDTITKEKKLDSKSPEDHPWAKYFSPEKAVDPKQFKAEQEVLDWLLSQKNIILSVKNTIQARNIYAALAIRAKACKQEFFYVESEKDIDEYIELLRFITEDQPETIPGPLKNILTQGGTWIVNWENFDKNQIRSYKSILDKKPLFSDTFATDQFKVISLITDKTKRCETLISRSKQFQWPSHIPLPVDQHPIKLTVNTEEDKKIDDDLYNDAEEGRNIILRNIHLETKRTRFLDAPLEDPHFQASVKRLLVERTDYRNDEKIKISDDLTIEFIPPKPPIKPETLHVLTAKNYIFDKKTDIFYLNSQTVDCLNMESIFVGGKIQDHKGWITYSSASKNKKLIIQTEVLSEANERKFYDAVTQSGQEFDWLNLSAASILPSEIKDITTLNPPFDKNSLITTADPYFIKNILEKELKVDVLTEQIMKTTDSGDLLENAPFSIKEKGHFHFEHQVKRISTALIKNKTVILHGTLSNDLYYALEPLFGQPPVLKLSNSVVPQPANGRLIVISTPLTFPVLLANYHQAHLTISSEALWKIFEEQLTEKQDKNNFKKIQEFYSFAEKIPHGKVGMPEFPVFNSQRIRNMLTALREKKYQNDNPIKAFFHHDYEKNSEEYAKLNVFAKILFGNQEAKPRYRVSKLIEHTSSSLWKKANCFNAAALRKLEKIDPIDKDQLSLLKMESTPQIGQSKPQQKTQKYIKNYLQTFNGIVLKGPPGSGKTYISLEYAKNHTYMFGEEKIDDFLESKPKEGEEVDLIIDEANLKIPGYWDRLRPVLEGPPSRKKVIFTCNPERYPGRSYHPLLQGLPTLYLAKWTKENLIDIVIKPYLTKHTLKWNEHKTQIEEIIDVYEKVKKISAPETVSLRDLLQALRRWIYHINEYKSIEAARDVCLAEWLYTFPDSQAKQTFLHENKVTYYQPEAALKKCSIIFKKILEEKNKDFYLCDTLRVLLAQINEDMDMAKSNTDVGEDGNPIIKSGVLLEGHSGLGKTALLEKLFLTKNIIPCQPSDLLGAEKKDRSNFFIHFTPSPHPKDLEHDASILEAAFDQGCKVLLDELDVSPALEEVLNQLLTGKSTNGSPPTFRGFYLGASQNGHYVADSEEQAKGLANRLHVYRLDEYTRQDLIELTSNILGHTKDIENIVDDYLYQKNLFPQAVNSRTFFEGLTQIKEEILKKPAKGLTQTKEEILKKPAEGLTQTKEEIVSKPVASWFDSPLMSKFMQNFAETIYNFCIPYLLPRSYTFFNEMKHQPVPAQRYKPESRVKNKNY